MRSNSFVCITIGVHHIAPISRTLKVIVHLINNQSHNYNKENIRLTLKSHFGITRWSLVLPNSDLRDNYVYRYLTLISRGHDRGYINIYAVFTSDSMFDRTNGPCTKQVLISCLKMSGKPILIQASYQ